jgi:hypothetical protein
MRGHMQDISVEGAAAGGSGRGRGRCKGRGRGRSRSKSSVGITQAGAGSLWMLAVLRGVEGRAGDRVNEGVREKRRWGDVSNLGYGAI